MYIMLSKYINNLIQNIPERDTPYELDVVLEGGVFNGSYELGILIFLKALEKKNYLNIKRISGTSVGAVAALKYVIDKLETSIENYEKFRKHFRSDFNLEILKEIITRDIENISAEQFDKIKNDVLYINYFDIEKRQHVLESKYTSKQHLKNTIMKSCHIPFLSNGTCCHQDDDRFLVDGGLPYIFPEREKLPNKHILYISVSGLTFSSVPSKLKAMLNTKNEKTIHGRALEGILDIYTFLLKGKRTAMCSFVDNWTLSDFILLRLKSCALTMVVYFVYLLFIFSKYIIPLAEKSELYHKLVSIWKDTCKDLFLYFCF